MILVYSMYLTFCCNLLGVTVVSVNTMTRGVANRVVQFVYFCDFNVFYLVVRT